MSYPVSACRGHWTQAAAGGWWTVGGISGASVVAVYQPIGAASLEASYLNKNDAATHALTPDAAPTWASATGWKFNDSNQKLVTDIVPNSGYSMAVRFSGGALDNEEGIIGVNDGAGKQFLIYSYSWGQLQFGDGAGDWRESAVASGVLAVSSQQGYLNGVAQGTPVTGWSGTNTRIIYIGKINNSDTFGGYIQAVAIYSTAITAAQVGLVSTAMAAL